MAFGESAGLLFKIKGDASDAIRAFNQTERASAGLTGSASKLTSSFSALLGPATLAAAGVAAVGVAAVAGVTALFNLSKQAAEFGDQIFDTAQKTNVSTDAIQAWNFVAEQSGSSVEVVNKSLAKFSTLLGQAALGNEKAQKTLHAYKITATDTDAALAQAIKTIAEMTDKNKQNAAAAELFKDRGGDVINMIREMNGDLPGTINKLRDMGILMGKDDVKAAAEFTDQMDLLDKQISAVARNIGIEFMPIFRDMASALSDFVKNNKDDIREWGSNLSLTIQGLIIKWKELKKAADDYYVSSAIGMLASVDPLLNSAARAGEATRAAARAAQTKLSYADMKRAGDTNTLPNIPTTSPVGDSEGSRRNQAVLEAAKRDFAAGLRLAQDSLNELNKMFDEKLGKMIEQFNLSGDREAFQTDVDALIEWFNNAWLEADGDLQKLEAKQASRSKATKNELLELQDKQTDRQLGMTTRIGDAREDAAKREQVIEEKRAKEKEKNQEKEEKTEKENWEKRLERAAFEADVAQAEFNRRMDRLEKEKAALDAMGGGAGLTKDYDADLFDRLTAQEGGPFDAWTESWNTFADAIAERVGDIESSLGTMAGVLQHAFQGIANAIGSVVQQWVLYGTTGPAVMRKVLASALATIAAEAAVQAIYATALGFLKLAMGDFSGAAFAFGSAVLWASIAGVAAVAGRAVAGNAFQQQTSQATGTSASRAESNTSAQGRAYSSQKDYTHEEGRNAPLGVAVQISFKDKPEWFDRMFETRWRANGAIRRLVEDGR